MSRKVPVFKQSILFDTVVYTIVIFAVAITLYPFIYVLSASISNPHALSKGEVILLPKNIYFGSYIFILKTPEIWRAYYNTIWYTIVGTIFNIIFTVLAAYPLSRSQFLARKFYMFLFVFTMFFSGGMIPSYILISRLGLYNTRWVMIIPGLIATWNMIICRTYMQTTIPDELIEAAKIEGSSEFSILRSIVIPLSKPILATLTIFYGVGHWNSFFNALIYLRDPNLQPLQIILRRILLSASPDILKSQQNSFSYAETAQAMLFLQIKYAVIFTSILPILLLYPFLQKHFVKGIMIGSLKG